jgi:hypothetical protein
MSRAVKVYMGQPNAASGIPRKSMRTVCYDFEQLFYNETGNRIKLSPSVLDRLVKGGCTLQQARDEKTHLTPAETDLVIKFVVECGDRGFPLSHRRLKEHVDEILKVRLADGFPEGGVGKNWTQRFSSHNCDCLKVLWATSLEEKRGQGANPYANEAWWKLLHEVLEKYGMGFRHRLENESTSLAHARRRGLSINSELVHRRTSLFLLQFVWMVHHKLLLLYSKAMDIRLNGHKIIHSMHRKCFSISFQSFN